jgi:putative MATE family efflux protein
VRSLQEEKNKIEQAPQPGKKESGLAQVDRLGTAKVSKLMLEFAIPSIIGLVVNGLYNIIDSIFMGHGVGPVGLATATIAMPIMIVSMAVATLIGQGGNSLTALRLGAGKHDEAEKVMGITFILTMLAAVVCMVLVYTLMDPILSLSGATEETRESSRLFLGIISAGMVFQFFGMGFNNFIRTAGDPNRALYTMVIGTVVCIVLNGLFVMIFHWGVAGSAWATVIGQAVSAILVFWYFVFSDKAPFKLRRSQLKLEGRLVKSILVLGMAPFVLQVANAIISFLLNNQLVILGAATAIGSMGAQAALGVVGRIAMFTFFPILGVAFAAQPLFGYNYGAQNYARVKTTFKIALVWVTILGVFFWTVIHLFPTQIVYVFGVKGELEQFTITALKVQVFMMPIVGIQVVATQYFQSSGQPLKSLFVSVTRQLLYLIPLLYLLPHIIPTIFPSLAPLDGLYYAYPVSDFLSIITCVILVAFELRKINARIREQKTSTEKPVS